MAKIRQRPLMVEPEKPVTRNVRQRKPKEEENKVEEVTPVRKVRQRKEEVKEEVKPVIVEKKTATKKTSTTKRTSKKEDNNNVLQTNTELETKPQTKKKLTKRELIKKENAEKRAKAKQIKETAKLEEAESKVSQERKQNSVEEIPYNFKDATLISPTYVIVLTPNAEIYVDPIPRYTDFVNFRNFLTSCPDNSNEEYLNIKSEIKKISVPNGEMTYSIFDGSRKVNPFVDRFIDSKKGKVNIGGNLIFSGESRGLTKSESEKMFNWIVKTLQTPDVIVFKTEED